GAAARGDAGRDRDQAADADQLVDRVLDVRAGGQHEVGGAQPRADNEVGRPSQAGGEVSGDHSTRISPRVMSAPSPVRGSVAGAAVDPRHPATNQWMTVAQYSVSGPNGPSDCGVCLNWFALP